MKTAIYPGSFDPITLGHLDVIRRAAVCFDQVCVCVMANCEKKHPMFTPEERLEMIRSSIADLPNVEAELHWRPTGRICPRKGRAHPGQGCARRGRF